MQTTLFSLNLALALPALAMASTAERATIGISESYAEIKPYFECALDKSGIEYDLLYLPHSRVLYELETGTLDAGFPFVRRADRDKYAIASFPVLQSAFLLVHLESTDLDVRSGETRIAHLRGSEGVSAIAPEMAAAEKTPVSSWDQALALLKKERADAVVMTNGMHRSYGLASRSDITSIPAGDLTAGFYVADSNPELLLTLNDAILNCDLFSLDRSPPQHEIADDLDSESPKS